MDAQKLMRTKDTIPVKPDYQKKKATGELGPHLCIAEENCGLLCGQHIA